MPTGTCLEPVVRWRSSKISKKIKVREICWNVGSIETSKTFFLYISQKTCKIYDILKQGRMLMEIVWVVCGGVAHKFSHLPLMLVTVSIPMLIPENITNRVDVGSIPNWRWRLRLDIGPMSIRVAVYAGSYQTQLLNVGLISIRYWFRRLDIDPTSSRIVRLAGCSLLWSTSDRYPTYPDVVGWISVRRQHEWLCLVGGLSLDCDNILQSALI